LRRNPAPDPSPSAFGATRTGFFFALQVAQPLGVGAAGVLQGVGEERQANSNRKSPHGQETQTPMQVAKGSCQSNGPAATPGSPAGHLRSEKH
jgi:hypothetical protein